MMIQSPCGRGRRGDRDSRRPLSPKPRGELLLLLLLLLLRVSTSVYTSGAGGDTHLVTQVGYPPASLRRLAD